MMEEKIWRTYPYLGRKVVDGKTYVVLFVEPELGTVVMTETEEGEIKLGAQLSFDEDSFEYMPPEECVRLSNDFQIKA
ncbi:MAG: hypothetical protein J6Y37_15870 [Paludibacteraceae bacterium]|nr:hypothetical protein [Paludibacteraceae bacterium]